MKVGIVVEIVAACVIAFVSGDCVDSTTYNGTLNVTILGFTCQRWDSQHPYRHTTNTSKHFPNDASVHNAHNYCRNPLGLHDQIWCYVTNDTWFWDYCVDKTDTCQGPDVDKLDCCDLSEQLNSTHCTNDTVYYICNFDFWSNGRLTHILYDFHCQEYQCCRYASTNDEHSASTCTSITVQPQSSDVPPIAGIQFSEETTTQLLSSSECLVSYFKIYLFIFLHAMTLLYSNL